MSVPSVLIVDDRELNLQLLESLLVGLPARLIRCTSGEQAIEAAQNEHPAVVLLDVQMPSMDGFTTARSIRELPEREHVPIIFITAQNDPKTIRQGYESGAVDFLPKPLDARLVRAKVKIFLDLFEQKIALARQAAELERQSRYKSDFLANMSHELRTPLNVIIGFTQLMVSGRAGPTPEKHQEYLGDVLTSAEHLQHVINEVLDLAKVESGKMSFEVTNTDVGALLQEVVRSHEALMSGKRITSSIELATEIEKHKLDPSRLRQILYNYLSNAIKFTPEGGRIVVRAKAEGAGGLRLEVEDSGIGIPPELRDSVFESFHQLDNGPGKRYGGTGLGLAVTRRIVEAQGGRVGVHAAPRGGSIFWAELPLFIENQASCS